jgi:TolB-like protein
MGICLLLGCRPAQPAAVTPERRAAEEAARAAVANERALDAASLPAASVGVPPFDVGAADTSIAPLAYGLADLLTTDLARSGKIQVVDRLRLDAVLREIRLVKSGRVDTTTAPRVGRMVQARRLVLGSLSEQGDGELAIDARIADIGSGAVRTAVSAHAPLEQILRAEKELAFRIFEQLGVTLSPAERSAVEQLPTRSVTALLAYSRGVRFEAEGRYSEAAREYREALRSDPGFQPAAARLDTVEREPGAAPAPQRDAGATRIAAATDVAGDRISGVFELPNGGQLIASPIEAGGDLELPTTITIIVTVPE